MINWLRYGWPRRHLARLVDYLPAWLQDRLLDFLYPDDMGVTFNDDDLTQHELDRTDALDSIGWFGKSGK